ncbi:DUF4190 domain-containing protein [Kitasatospora sp. NPDC093558]|uniref:DUF4190 domain-containing protein n=1 Tax=Kitasatospora sp. NPDC093558 TaxID=3155201 RepID=UPI003432B974
MHAQGTKTPPRDAATFRPPTGTNRTATAALVLGVVGLVTSVVVFGGLLGLIGLVVGAVALRTAGRTGIGRGAAIAGAAMSLAAIVVSVLAASAFVWYADHTQPCYRPDSFAEYRQCVHQQLTGD